ncbi:unnamed protein product [Notodromas monacha]|uniref:GPN-loop GTPase 3 n=1 Tax=Notodromas monacha TaxID=399045 RepID=A0A7R9BWS6_9CRUS|nr:unnamed protein product [Notodromas monacha]CAG0921839.1 unnamed protein product [Notodromas monacha]
MRYAQLVMGPAGSGKSTYCTNVQRHAEDSKRSIHVINLDPAAERFDYVPALDIRDLIQLSDAMEDEDLMFGPNGGLVFCMEYLINNIKWLEDELGSGEDDYYLLDCPGQIELFTHMNVIRTLVEHLEDWNFRVCGVFVLDANFVLENSKFISGSMVALAAMANLAIPHVNIITKMDLLSKSSKKRIERQHEHWTNSAAHVGPGESTSGNL